MNVAPRMPQGEPHHEPRPGFFADRWRGTAPLGTVFWRDMMLVATLINLATSFGSLLLLGFKAPAWLWFGAYLSPLPYNLFLVAAVWRISARVPPSQASAARLGAVVWLVIATLI